MALTKSQRLTLMREIASRLAGEEWSVVDISLKAFALPTQNTWSGSTESYVLEMVSDSTDEALIELAQHLGYVLDQNVVQRLEPTFWRKGQFRLFLSHLSANKAWVGELQDALSPYGITAFVAHKDIEPTTEWQNQIELALMTCEALIALLHLGFHQSNWTDQEIGFAMGRRIPTFSVRCGEDPYGFIGRFQAFNGLNAAPKDLAKEIWHSLLHHKETQRRMCDVTIQLFEESDSFNEAQARVKQLEEIPAWDASYEKRLNDAVENNYQISNAFYVPGKVKAFINKWKQVT